MNPSLRSRLSADHSRHQRNQDQDHAAADPEHGHRSDDDVAGEQDDEHSDHSIQSVSSDSAGEEESDNNNPVGDNNRASNASVPRASSSSSSSAAAARIESTSSRRRSPAASSSSVSLWSDLFRVLTFPFNLVLDTIWRIARFAIGLLNGEPTAPHDPRAEVDSFISDFERDYGQSHPQFFRGSYLQAVTQAKRDFKFLLIFLHSESDPESEEFCRSVLTHPEVIGYLNQLSTDQLVLWACGSRSYEAFKVSEQLHSSSAGPFLGLIVQKEEGLMRLVRRIAVRSYSAASVESFISQLDSGIREHESFLIVGRQERAARIMNQEIRRQQDQDYEISLQADRIKEQEKAAERAKREAEEKAKAEAIDAAIRMRDELLALKVQLRDSLPEEPSADEEDTVRLLIKLPDGTRIERRFKTSQSISRLSQFVFAQETAPHRFHVLSNFPRRVLPCPSPVPSNPACLTVDGKAPPTFRDVGLTATEALFVQDLES